MGSNTGKTQQNTIQICFQNVGGIILQANKGLKLMELRSFTQQQEIDIFTFAEHNICWDLIPKNLQLADRTHGWWESAPWSTAYNKHKINPTTHQPGGTRLVVINSLSHRVVHLGGDKSGMGRWSWSQLKGKERNIL